MKLMAYPWALMKAVYSMKGDMTAVLKELWISKVH